MCKSYLDSMSHISHYHFVILAILDLLVLVANVLANSLVIYILIKTREIRKFSCRLIFMLCVSDLNIAITVQTFYITQMFSSNCSINLIYQLTSGFFPRASAYTIGLIGIDRYIRIKYKTTFKTILTTKFLIILVTSIYCLAMAQTLIDTLGILLNKNKISSSIVVGIDICYLSLIIFLQIKTISTANSIQREASNPHLLQDLNKKIIQLCSRIMICCATLYLPYLIINLVRNIRNGVVKHEGFLLQFLFMLSIVIAFSNSLGNAILFLLANKKAKRFLQCTLTIRSDEITSSAEPESNYRSEESRWQPLKNLNFKLPQILLGPFLNTLTQYCLLNIDQRYKFSCNSPVAARKLNSTCTYGSWLKKYIRQSTFTANLTCY